MTETKITNGKGISESVSAADLEKLEMSLRGRLLRPGDDGYNESRTIWNAMIDRKPALIIQCAGVSDVKQAVNFAREHGLLTAIRSIGHNIAGSAICDGGLVIDLTMMRSMRVDPIARRAHVEPGVTLGDFDHETQAFGLVAPTGINSTTGIAGLTLGGGFGWLSRKYGMTVDNLVAADVVTADGQFLRASETENPDLFWAIRGGGGNFGIVTRFEFALHPMDTQKFCGLMVFPISEASAILKQHREFVASLDDDSSVWVVLREAPPLPFLPKEVHGTKVVVMAMFHAGDPEKGKKILDPMRNFGTLLGEHLGVVPFTGWQAAFDPLLAPGARNYWKSHNFIELNDETIDLAIEYTKKINSPHSEIFIAQLGGAVNRVDAETTAYSHRDINFVINVHGRWEKASDDKKCIKWARDFFNATSPHATGGVYINFMTEEETDRIGAAYGKGYERLLKAKRMYDPNNLFRMNQNINPE